MRTRRIPAIAAALAAALVLLGAPAASSAADPPPGSYAVWSCRDAAGAPLSTVAWVPIANIVNPLSHSDTCATPGGWLGVQMIDPADYAGGSMTGYAFTAPAGTSIASYAIEMAGKTSSPSGGTHFEVGLMIGGDPLVRTGDGCNEDLDPCTFGDWTAAWDAPANVFAASSLAAGGIVFGATCTAPSGCVTGTDNLPYPAFGRLYRSAVVLTDANPPAVGAIAGSVTDAGPISGRRAVGADVSDLGGGVFRTQLLVDGAVVDQADGRGRCAVPFTAAAPCPDAQRAQFELDTTRLSDGPHAVVVRAYDAALNAADSAPLEVRVDNAAAAPVVVTVPGATVTTPGAPAAPRPGQESPSSDDAVLPITLRTPSPRQTLPLDRALRGTAVGPRGVPQAGVAVRFLRRAFGAGARGWKVVGSTRTGPDGRYTLPVVHRAGQLRIEVAAAGYTARPAIVSFMERLRVRVRPSARTLRNGDTVTLHGEVAGDGGAQRGRNVLVQAQVRGAWRTVDSAEIGARGRVVWRYRFTSTAQTARYRFRLVLPRGRGLPWARTATDPVAVLVRGGSRG
jgi:hypothetical protein